MTTSEFEGKVGYLAGPMAGIEDYNFPAFHKAAAELRSGGLVVLSPAELAGGVSTLKRERYFRYDFTAMITLCDYVVLLPGWTSSAGAKAEVVVATEIGLPIFYFSTGVLSGVDISGWHISHGANHNNIFLEDTHVSSD